MGKLKKDIVEVIRCGSQPDPPSYSPHRTVKSNEQMADQILAHFKAHIKGVPRPENPHHYMIDPPTKEWAFENGAKRGFDEGIAKDREKIEESLKGEMG